MTDSWLSNLPSHTTHTVNHHHVSSLQMQERLKKIAAISGLRDAELGALDEGFLDEDWDPAKYEVTQCMSVVCRPCD